MDRLAHTPQDDPDHAWLEELATAAYEPFTTSEEITQALAVLRERATNELGRARLEAALTPRGEGAHLQAMHGLARAVFTSPVPSSQATGALPTYLGRLAHTLLTEPGIAHAPLQGQSRPLQSHYRDLPPAEPFATPDGVMDDAAIQQAHKRVSTWAKRAAEQCRTNESAAERRLAAACTEIQQRPLTAPDGHLYAWWPHLLASAAGLARQVMREHRGEGHYAPGRRASPTSPKPA